MRAAERLAGNHAEEVCSKLQLWRDRGQRELPWLAGPAFSALASVSVAPPEGADLTVLKRFLIGMEADAPLVLESIDRCAVEAGPPGPPLPPDARGALVDATDRFFDLLAEAYGSMHTTVRTGHRRYVEDLLAEWQPRLDEAAADIKERADVLQGRRRPAAAPPRKPVPERSGLAAFFVLLALLGATAVLWLVVQGWPLVPVGFDI